MKLSSVKSPCGVVGGALCGSALLAACSYPWLEPWLLRRAAARYSVDHLIGGRGETLLALVWLVGAAALALAGVALALWAHERGRAWLAALLADDPRFARDAARPQGLRTLAAAGALALSTVAFGWTAGRRRWLWLEDGPVEALQVVLLLASAAVLVLAARQAVRLGKLALFGMAGLAFWACGEELSWGQRIFGWSTPSGWARLNVQQETNLHNLVPPLPVELHNLLPLAPAVLVGMTIAVTWAEARRGEGRPNHLARLLPPASLLPLAAAALGAQALRLARRVPSAELEEVALYLFLLLWSVTCWRRARALGDAQSSGPSARPRR